jgi:hypothetical protein
MNRIANEGDRLFFAIHDEALDMSDGQWLIEMGSYAGVLTKVVTYTTEDRRDRVVFPGQGDGIKKSSLTNGAHVLRDFLVDRAFVETGGLDAVEVVQLTGCLGAIHPK